MIKVMKTLRPEDVFYQKASLKTNGLYPVG